LLATNYLDITVFVDFKPSRSRPFCKVKYKKHSESANLRHAAIQNFVGSHIFHAKILFVMQIVKFGEDLKPRPGDFYYDGFDLEL